MQLESGRVGSQTRSASLQVQRVHSSLEVQADEVGREKEK